GCRSQIHRKPAEILIQYRKASLQDQKPDIARALKQRLDCIELTLDVDGRAVERTAVFGGEEGRRENALHGCKKIEITRITIHIEIRTAGVRVRKRPAQQGDPRIEHGPAATSRWIGVRRLVGVRRLSNIHRNSPTHARLAASGPTHAQPFLMCRYAASSWACKRC